MDETTDWAEEIERPTVAMPVFSVDTATNTTTLEWPDGKPEAVSMTPEHLETLVTERNETVATIQNLGETLELASTRIAELVGDNETLRRANARLEAQVTALRTVADILRLGRRPNREQWQATGMLPAHAQLESNRVD